MFQEAWCREGTGTGRGGLWGWERKGEGKRKKLERKKEIVSMGFLAAPPAGVREERAVCFVTCLLSLCPAPCIFCAGSLLLIPSHKCWQESEDMRA